MKKQIVKINEEGLKENFLTLKGAAASIDTKMDSWKIEMLISNAINTHKSAFKCRWKLE